MADDPPEITDPSAFHHGSLGKQVLFTVLTLGIYSLYWWYRTNEQLDAGTSAEISPGLRTIGLLIPIYNLIVIWRFSNDVTAVTDQEGLLLFLAFLVFAPIVWYLVQTGINEIAEAASTGGEGSGAETAG
jgi:nicotinamide riboside transporter PnuC